MSFSDPYWLLLLPVLALVGWRIPRLGVFRPLRASLLVLLVVALSGPGASSGGLGRDVALIVDRSSSVGEELTASRQEWEGLVARSKGSADRLFIYDFAAEAVRRDRGDPGFPVARDRSKLTTALRLALAERDPERPLRLLVLSDGYSTEPLGGMEAALLPAGIPVDFRLTNPPVSGDYRVAGLRLPARALPGTAELVEFRVEGGPDADVPWEVLRNGVQVGSGVAQVRSGQARVRLTDRMGAPGVLSYQVLIRGDRDPRPENDRATGWVQVTGGRRALLLSGYSPDPLEEVLGRQGWQVERVARPDALTAQNLAGVRLVVVNNLPAWRVSPDFLAALDFFVRAQGGGLMMAGGRASFASGGYFESAIDPLIPVSMEQRTEHRKLLTALAVVMDRSGSMSASAGDGKVKMDLANEGAARAAELLGEKDQLTVFAVDSEPHEILPLMPVGPNRSLIEDTVRRIDSTGGGIFVYAGLKAGWESLQQAKVGQRHLVLFSDAADSEEPGEYRALLAEMTTAGATVSVIALGTEADPDADLLRDVALRGNGRIFFTRDASSLPQIFAQETVSIARSAFLDAPVGVNPTAGWLEVSPRPLEWLSEVDGYNLTYLREGATASALTRDEYAAPLVAGWQRGLGRVAAVTFPLAGAEAVRAREWPRYGEFAGTLARWLGGEETPEGVSVRARVSGERLRLELLHEAILTEQIAARPPRVVVARGAAGSPEEVPWRRLGEGRFESELELSAGNWVRGAVEVAGSVIPFGPIGVTGDAEWAFDPARLRELTALSRATGGRELVNLEEVWELPMPPGRKFDVTPWILALALVLLVGDALQGKLRRG